MGRELVLIALLLATVPVIRGCSRALFNQYDIVLSGRSMDWVFSFEDLLFVYPRGEHMDGGTADTVQWTSKYGSVVSSLIGYAEQFGYDFEKDGGTDGINEAGLAAHVLYLGETQYPTPSADGKNNITYLRWLRYLLDNFGTVSEAVEAMERVNIVQVFLDGHSIGAHMAIEDRTGDSAVFEIIQGKVIVYHGKHVRIMTNDPPYNEQQALLKNYIGFGGDLPLPGSTASDDRFVRLSFFLPFLKEPKDDVQAVAKVQSLMMSTNVPFDAPDGYDVNTIFPSWWNSYCDLTNLVYYFSWLETPFLIWTELKDLDFTPGRNKVLVLDPKVSTIYGDVSSLFMKTQDYKAARKSGAGNNSIYEAAILSCSFSKGCFFHKGQRSMGSQAFTTVFAALVAGCAIGFFVHKSVMASSSRRSHYHPIGEAY